MNTLARSKHKRHLHFPPLWYASSRAQTEGSGRPRRRTQSVTSSAAVVKPPLQFPRPMGVTMGGGPPSPPPTPPSCDHEPEAGAVGSQGETGFCG